MWEAGLRDAIVVMSANVRLPIASLHTTLIWKNVSFVTQWEESVPYSIIRG